MMKQNRRDWIKKTGLMNTLIGLWFVAQLWKINLY